MDRRAPCEVSGLWALPVVTLAAGDSHSAALTTSGFLFTWGANDRGQLGLPKNAESASQVGTLAKSSNIPLFCSHPKFAFQTGIRPCG
jgi:alpha-tubulin suppressor-like RCC1 family protein